MILLINERIQEGYYSHHEGKFYVQKQVYLPKYADEEVVRTVDEINNSLEWDTVEIVPDKWMLIASN